MTLNSIWDFSVVTGMVTVNGTNVEGWNDFFRGIRRKPTVLGQRLLPGLLNYSSNDSYRIFHLMEKFRPPPLLSLLLLL
jgi:hypothetical protein